MENMQQQNNREPFNKNVVVICGTIILVALIVAGAVLYSNATTKNGGNVGNNAPVAQQQPNQTAVDVSKVKIAGHPFIGDPNAKVTIAYWYDYQCPFCQRVEQQVWSQVIKEYVDTGKVKIVYKDYQFLGADSQTAGWAEHAVWEVAPKKFYEWHKAMYDKQDNENSGWGSRADILALTKSLGIDSAKVDQLMTTKVQEYQKAMDADKAEGTSFGVNGTPGTIIGKQLISGAQPYTAFKAVIDEVLKGK